MLGGSWLGLNLPLVLAAAQTACSRREANEPWANLTPSEAETLAAVVDQIIPPDSTPGASEVGVVHFIDAALGSFLAAGGRKLRKGIKDLDERAGGDGFAHLDFDQQTALLKSVEDTSSPSQSAGHSPNTLARQFESSLFFRTMLDLTRMGMFALPEYGGNRDHAGWKLVGFEHRHVWQAPYGYYDTQAAESEKDSAGS